jgi:hypothetical protein
LQYLRLVEISPESVSTKTHYKMYSETQFFAITVLAILHCFGESCGQDLEAKISNSTLPMTLKSTSTVYDGKDNIYIFGG